MVPSLFFYPLGLVALVYGAGGVRERGEARGLVLRSTAWGTGRRDFPVCASQQVSPQVRRRRCKSPRAVAERVSYATSFTPVVMFSDGLHGPGGISALLISSLTDKIMNRQDHGPSWEREPRR